MLKKSLFPSLLILLIVTASYADVPHLINYQGWLTDSGGNPLNATVSIQFKIYNSETAGSVLWSETQSVNVTDGMFSVLLGSVSQIPYSVFEDSVRYLALQVGTDSEMVPRKRIASVGYSFQANNSDKLDGKESSAFVQKVDDVSPDGSGNIDLVAGNNVTIIPDSPNNKITISASASGGGDNDWTISGNDMYSAVSGNVGIGTTAPQAGLHVSGSGGKGVIYSERSGKILVFNPNYSDNNQFAHVTTAYGSDMGLKLGANEQTGLTISTVGKVGIGTSYPFNGMLVIGSDSYDEAYIALQPGGSANNDFVGLRATHAGNNTTKLHFGKEFSTNSAFIDLVTIEGSTGNVGIGTTEPDAKLHVIGNNQNIIFGEHSNGNYGLLGTLYLGAYGCQGNSSSYGSLGSTSYGVYGYCPSGYGGYFYGKGRFSGLLEKPGGGFLIDHPLDPANKYLNHSFVESPDMKNVYDGIAVLNAAGEADIELPDWFEALNKDFRYQLTCIGEFAQLYIAEKITNNRFKIAGGSEGMEVSWQVTGIRKDAFANANRIQVEVEKEGSKRGKYLHPKEYGLPEMMSEDYEEIKKMKEAHQRLVNEENK